MPAFVSAPASSLPPDAPFAVTVLGSGSPFSDPRRVSSGYLVWVNGTARLLIDAGGGTFERLGRIGVNPAQFDAVLLTHTHIDHSGGLPPIVFASLMQGRDRALQILGPSGRDGQPGCRRFCELLFGADGAWSYLHSFEGFVIDAHEVPEGAARPQRVVLDHLTTPGAGNPEVTAVGVAHGMMPALAYRIDHAGRSVVFSGDVEGASEPLAALAQGCDVLVHDQALPRRDMPHGDLHPPPEETAANAVSAGARTLVLTHLMPPALDELADVARRVASCFAGRFEVAADLSTIIV